MRSTQDREFGGSTPPSGTTLDDAFDAGRVWREIPPTTRLGAKKRWSNGRALGVLIQHYRVQDRLRGWAPTVSPGVRDGWAEHVRRTGTGFYPGSRSFNAAYQQWMAKRRGPRATDLKRKRWVIAQMVKHLRRCRVVQR